MRISWRNLDWLPEEARALIQHRLEELGGETGSIDRVDFVGTAAGEDSYEIQALGKIGKSQIKAIRCGSSGEQALARVLVAFEESAHGVLAVAAQTPQPDPVAVEPVPPLHESASHGARLAALRERAGSSLQQLQLPRISIPAVSLSRISDELRRPTADAVAAIQARMQAFRAHMARELARAESLRPRWPSFPAIRVRRIRIPDLRSSLSLPSWSLSSLSLSSLAEWDARVRVQHTLQSGWDRIRRVRGVAVPRLRALQQRIPALRLASTRPLVARIARVAEGRVADVRSWGPPVARAVGVGLSQIPLGLHRGVVWIGQHRVPAAAALSGFMLIGVVSIQVSSFTGRSVPPEIRPDEVVYTAFAGGPSFAGVLTSPGGVLLDRSGPRDASLEESAPAAFSATASPALLDLGALGGDPQDDLASMGSIEPAFQAIALPSPAVFSAIALPPVSAPREIATLDAVAFSAVAEPRTSGVASRGFPGALADIVAFSAVAR